MGLAFQQAAPLIENIQYSESTCWVQDGPEGEYTVHFNSYAEGGKVGKPDSIKVDVVIGADGANSRVAKEIDAGELS